MKRLQIYLVILGVLVTCNSAFGADTQPISEGAATVPNEEAERRTEAVLRLGNESNPVDGFLGPFTYGVRGSHRFENDYAIEAGYIKMHEPNTPTFQSVIDEAQATLRIPEYRSFVVDATAWKNRMVDMYTNLIGIEVTKTADVSATLGVYVGTATREEVSRNFRGVQVGLSSEIGSVELIGECLLGKIEKDYRKCGFEADVDFGEGGHLPLTATFAIEERYFDFGRGGSAIEPRDEWIFISGLEIHLLR